MASGVYVFCSSEYQCFDKPKALVDVKPHFHLTQILLEAPGQLCSKVHHGALCRPQQSQAALSQHRRWENTVQTANDWKQGGEGV